MAALHIRRRRDTSRVEHTGRRFGRLSRDDRGVAAVEAAIVTPLFLLLIIGIIEFGLVFKDQLAITSAVRAGARIASAEPRIATFATDAAAQVAREGSALNMADGTPLWVYQAGASGRPVNAGPSDDGFGSCNTNCVQFSWDRASKSFVKTADSWPSGSQNACQGTQQSVGVYLKYAHPWVTQNFIPGSGHINLDSYTVMRLEPIPATQGCS